MTTPAPATVFRPRRYDKVLSGIAVLLSLVFVAAGAASFVAVGLHPILFAFTILGLICTAVAVGSMFTRTVVTAESITKLPMIAGGFSLRWADVESWEQLPRISDDAPCIRFRSRGHRIPRVVFDYEVEEPGFETFTACVRRHASTPEAAHDAPKRP